MIFILDLDTFKRWSTNIPASAGLPTVPPPFLPLQHTAVNVCARPKPGGGGRVSDESDDVIGWREGGRAAESVRVPARGLRQGVCGEELSD
jgi:hypothetical protein